ncbi:hypothetical protein [Novosphingobium sp.]|uniref:hypothetical protein n=1 Tax=Novosphingobium sp. TaxID=1874826 RepID=UPI003BAB0696
MAQTSTVWRLPTMGRGEQIVIAATWGLLAVFLVVGTVGAARIMLDFGAAASRAWLPLGISFDSSANRIETALPEAVAAGARVGDQIEAIDGVAVPRHNDDDLIAAEQANRRLLVNEGQPVTLTVRHPGGAARRVELVHRERTAQRMLAPAGLSPAVMTWLCVGLFALAPVVLAGGALLLFRRRAEPVAALLSVGLLALAAIAGNQAWFFMVNGAWWLFEAVAMLAFAALVTTCLSFPTGEFRPRWTGWLALALLPLIVCMVLLPASVFPIVVVVAVLSLGALVQRYRSETRDARRQWRWAMLGFVLAFGWFAGVGWILDSIIYPAFPAAVIGPWTFITTPALYAITALLITGGLVMSLLRYRLYDAPVVISRSLLYGGMTLALVAIFAGTEKIIEIVGEKWFGESIGALAGGLGAAFAAVAIGPLHHRIGHFVEHRFRADLVRLRRDGPILIDDLAEAGGREHLIDAVCELLVERLHVQRAAVVVRQTAAGEHGLAMSIDHHDSTWPIRVPLNHATTLQIGPRPDGSLCDAQEREAIGDLALRLARVLSVLARRETREAALLVRIARIEAALALVAEAMPH